MPVVLIRRIWICECDVVVQYVEASERLDGRSDHSGNIGFDRYVGDASDCTPALSRDFGNDPRASIHKVAEYLYTGELMTARQAMELGLVNHVYGTPEEVDAEALKLARLPTHGLTFTKRLLRKHVARRFLEDFDEGAALEQLRGFVAKKELDALGGWAEAARAGKIPGWEYDKNRNEVDPEKIIQPGSTW